jgi:hypothetical protein
VEELPVPGLLAVVEPAGGPPPAPTEFPGGLPVDVAELPVPGLVAMVEVVPGLVVSGPGFVPRLIASGVEAVPGEVEAIPRLVASGVEPIPGLAGDGQRERFSAGLAAAAPFGDDRGADGWLAGTGHRLASYRQMM